MNKFEFKIFSSRINPMGLIVSLDENNTASGDLFWDDGVSFNFGSQFLTHLNKRIFNFDLKF